MSLRSIVTFALLWLLQLPALAAIGTIDSLEGEVRLISATVDRRAQAGSEINEGDTVRTGDNAWALLAMSDGASLTLRQNSQVRFDTYRYNPEGDVAKNTSVLSLAKGALRSITGYIGRTNRAGYKIATPTATIGIRGTDHEPAYYPPGAYSDRDPGTYDKVNDGESFIRNPKGEVAVKPGQYAFVHHNARFAPQLLKRPPAFYQRHAEFDKKVAARRQEFHRKFEEQHQRLLKERAQRPQKRQNEKQQLREKGKLDRPQQSELKEKQQRQRLEQKQQRRDLLEQRKQERAQMEEQRKQQHAEEQKKRQREREQKRELKKEREHEQQRDRKKERDHEEK